MDMTVFPELSPEIEAVRDMVNRFMENEVKPSWTGSRSGANSRASW
jgi:hypothetical protein